MPSVVSTGAYIKIPDTRGIGYRLTGEGKWLGLLPHGVRIRWLADRPALPVRVPVR